MNPACRWQDRTAAFQRDFSVGAVMRTNLIRLLSLALVGCSGTTNPEPRVDEPPARPLLLVVNKSSGTLSALDPQTGEEVAVATTGFAPHEVAVTADGALAVVTDYGTGALPGKTLTVIELAGFRVARTIDLTPHTMPHGIAPLADGTVWVTTEGSRHVLRVDPQAGAIVTAVETSQQATHQVAVSEARDRVITANIGSGNATVVDGSSGAVVAHVATGAGAEGIDVHPDGRRVYVTNRAAGTLSEIDLETNTVTRSLPVGSFPIRVKVVPDGRLSLVSNAIGNEVVAVDLSRWTVEQRLSVGTTPVGILITPDGGTAFVANTADDRITVIDLATWRVSSTLTAGQEPDGMAWVP
jgi:YVTN family beta-propeller protein